MAYNSKYKGSEVDSALDLARTALQKHQDISGKVDKVSGKQLSTEDFTTALKQKLEGLSNYNDAEIQTAVQSLQTQLNTLVSGNADNAINSFNEIIAFLDGIKDSQDLSSIIASIEQQIASKMDKVTLANVATSGSYNDLKDKPTIPSAVTESTVSGWGFTKNTGTYSKPSGGIPKSDLASEVQTSLGKADTALQSYTEQYKGTVTGVKINGTTKNPSSGVVDLGTVITSHQDISGKQDKLVSGTNIKTINGTSILGSGNIVIEGGSSSGGEDIRFFTDFTVEAVKQHASSGTTISNDATDLMNAARNNKLICIPYADVDKGYMVASYQFIEHDGYLDFRVALNEGGAEYSAYLAFTGDGYAVIGGDKIQFATGYQEIEVYDGEAYCEIKDNSVCYIFDPVEYLYISYLDDIIVGSTIKFISGENTTIETYDSLCWANGVVPTIEPYTRYELSLAYNTEGYCNAVLTPFKYVQQ